MKMGHFSMTAEDYLPNIQGILKTVWRNKDLMILVGGATLVLGVLFVLTRPTYYKASALVMLEDRPTKLNNFNDVTEGDRFSDFSVQTEVKVLSSPSVALQTIKKVDLDKNPEFSAGGDIQRTLAIFEDRLSVMPQGTSRVIEVTFKAKDPEVAAAVANAHVAAYLDYQVSNKKKYVEQLRGKFEESVKSLKEDVIKKAQAVGQFRAQEDLAVGKDSQELIYQQITSISDQLAPVQVHKDQAEAKLAALKAASEAGHVEMIDDVVKSPLIQRLREQESVLSQQYESQRTKFGVNHPSLIATKRELQEVKNSIAAEVKKIVGALENDFSSTTAQETMLKQRLDELKKQADNLRVKLITLNALVVEQEASQKLLDNFLANYENIQSQTSFAQADAFAASPAIVPNTPAPPGKVVLLLIVIVFSGSVALGAAFIREMLRGGLHSFDDIRKNGFSPVGIVPLEVNPVHILLSRGNSSVKEAMKRIYMQALMNNQAKTILLTSALPKEGRTTFTALLAHYLTFIGHKTLVIDADFHHPGLGALVGGTKGAGFADILAGHASWNEVVRQEKNGLYVVNAGHRKAVSPDDLTNDNLGKVLSQIVNEFAYVLIDSGPMLSFTEAAALANQVDGILAVVEWANTPLSTLTNMFSALKTFSTPTLGIVLNKVDLDKYKTSVDGADFLLPKVSEAT